VLLLTGSDVVERFTTDVEPYVSFRWLLGVVLGAMALQSLLATFFFLRELAGPVHERSARDEQLARLLKLYGKLLLLRALSLETVRRHLGLVAQIVVLLVAAVALNVWIFAHGG
jgi:hypothetical protein